MSNQASKVKSLYKGSLRERAIAAMEDPILRHIADENPRSKASLVWRPSTLTEKVMYFLKSTFNRLMNRLK